MADQKGVKRSSFVKLTDDLEERVSKIGVKVTGEEAQHVIAEIGGNSGSRRLYFDHVTDSGGSDDMNVNGSLGSPKEFITEALPGEDLLVKHLIFEAFDGGIKIDNFLGQNSALTNGILIEVKARDEVFQFLPITTTQELDSHFAFGNARSFELIVASGNDSVVARFGLDTPLILKAQGTYPTNDYVKVLIRDNLSNIAKLRFLIEGSLV